MKVLVRGLGNIGTTLALVLLRHRRSLAIDEVRVLKGQPLSFDRQDLRELGRAGAHVFEGDETVEEAMKGIDYLFDTRASGAPRACKSRCEARGLRACAQGTEEGFGPAFVHGINDEAIANVPFVRVGSCNTHAICALARAVGGMGETPSARSADFVVVRRSEDVGGHARLVAATVVARHRHERGTHHAHDAGEVLESAGRAMGLTSSDATTPSQLLHSVRFSFRFPDALTPAALHARLEADRLVGTTSIFDSNRIFERGRRFGFLGRIYAHAIVVDNNLLMHRDGDAHVCSGWAFIPQEGNTIVSTIAAFLGQMGQGAEGIRPVIDDLVELRW